MADDHGLEVICYVDTDLTLPDDTLLYSPSSRAPDPNAFEVSTIYSNDGGTMERSIGAWDWSIPNNYYFNWKKSFTWFEQNGYFGTSYGGTCYNLVLCKDPYGDYALYLYNYDTEQWTWQTASQGPRDVDGYGQCYYEFFSYSGTPLPSDVPIIEASNIMIYHLVAIINGSPYYVWDLNYDYLGLSSEAWSDDWLNDMNVPHGWCYDKYYYDWYVGS